MAIVRALERSLVLPRIEELDKNANVTNNKGLDSYESTSSIDDKDDD